VVFLHGYGADGDDLIEIGRQWQRWLPDAPSWRRTRPSCSPASPRAGSGSP
jgi:phospholipase/carboxylesterase